MPDYKKPAKGIRFAGSKGRCRELIRVVNSFTSGRGFYYEPFLGAAKVMQSVAADVRAGSDIDRTMVALLNSVQSGWNPPDNVSEREYKVWMNRRSDEKYLDHPMLAFVGYACSFGARYYQGYARSKSGAINFAASARAALLRQKPYLENVRMFVANYRQVPPDFIGTPCVAYMDPPYLGTKPVGSNPTPFDSVKFWKWANDRAKTWTVLVSEYECPLPDAEVVWQKSVAAGLRYGTGGDGGATGSGKMKVEKLFLLRPKSRRGSLGLGI